MQKFSIIFVVLVIFPSIVLAWNNPLGDRFAGVGMDPIPNSHRYIPLPSMPSYKVIGIPLSIPSPISGPSSSWRDERIISADYMTRPKTVPGPFDHHGIRVNTNLGNQFLIHNTPKEGVVATPQKLSSNWQVDHSIHVIGEKTMGSAMKASPGIGTDTLKYITGMTCIGAANTIESYLKK